LAPSLTCLISLQDAGESLRLASEGVTRSDGHVLYAHELGLVPITAPAYSAKSNGLATTFVATFKRDYVDGAELRDGESVLAQLARWIDDSNTRAPHSALGMRTRPTNGWMLL